MAGFDPTFKVNPPLRTAADVAAVQAGLADGTIDAIATDHAPHTPESKEAPFDEAPPGMLGLETALSLALTELGAAGPGLSAARLVALMSVRPAAIVGLAGQGRAVGVGEVANLCVIDPAASWTVSAGALASRARNTPYAGRTLTGRVRHTVLAGEPVVIDAEAQR